MIFPLRSEGRLTPVPDSICCSLRFSRKEGLHAHSLFGEVILGNKNGEWEEWTEGKANTKVCLWVGHHCGNWVLPYCVLLKSPVDGTFKSPQRRERGASIHQHLCPTGQGSPHRITSLCFHSATVWVQAVFFFRTQGSMNGKQENWNS